MVLRSLERTSKAPLTSMGVSIGAPHPPSGETPWVQRVEFCAQYLLAVNRNAELCRVRFVNGWR